MDNRQERTIATLYRILDYLDHNPMRPEPPMLGSLRGSLQTAITRVEKLQVDQLMASNDMRGNVERRVRDLRRGYMMPLVRIARPLLAFAADESALTVPHARADALTVAGAALRMCAALAPHQKLLAEAGCTKEYMQKFHQEAKELALSATNTQSARQRRSQATAEIAAELSKTMETLAIIEGIVMMYAAGDKNAISHWKQVRRVQRRIGRPKVRGKAARRLPA